MNQSIPRTSNEPEKVELLWKNLTLKTLDDKVLLENINGKIEPGTMVALMGSSGAGKTTLLNSLTGRISSNLQLTGEILVNGYPRREEDWSKISSYVSQVFYAYENQTVQETLEFVYKIRRKDLDGVEDLLNLLSLGGTRNTYVGKLSGGERIRLSVGLELIGNPSVLFLDEPISGLDSTNAIKILEFLSNLARSGRTLIVTIHQPSYKMISYFDKMYLMAKGGVAYDGTVDGCIEFFTSIGYPLPEHTNPADHFLDTIAIDTTNEEESMERINHIKNEWKNRNTPYEVTLNNRIERQHLEHRCLDTTFWDLYWRNLVDFTRNIPLLKTKLAQRITIAFLLSITYWFIGKNDPISVYSFRGIFTFITLNELFGICAPIFNLFKQEQRIVLRERQSGFYSGYMVYSAKFLSEFTTTIIIELLYLTVIYVLTGFFDSFVKYLQFILILIAEITFGICLGLTVSVIAPTANSAQALGATLNILFILYSAAFISPDDLPAWNRWLIYLSPLQYTFNGIIRTQAKGREFTLDTSTEMSVSDEIAIESFGIENIPFGVSVLVVFGFAGLFVLLGALTLHRQTRNKIKTE